MKPINQLTEQIIGAAIEVHREKGPGLLESAYENCLAHELGLRGLQVTCQVAVSPFFKSVPIDVALLGDPILGYPQLGALKANETVFSVHKTHGISYIRENRPRM